MEPRVLDDQDGRRRGATERVVAYVRGRIERGELQPGDRLLPERDLARHLGVSRPTVRAAMRALSSLGIVHARRGAGTFIADGPPTLAPEPLNFLAALHGFSRRDIFEARRILELGACALASRQATGQQLATLADEVASLYAAVGDPELFRVQDLRFHRAIGIASGNPIVSSLVELVTGLADNRRRASGPIVSFDPQEIAATYRRIYHAIRDRDGVRASAEMDALLRRTEAIPLAEDLHATELAGPGVVPIHSRQPVPTRH